MRPVAALVAITLLLLVGPLTAAAFAAPAQEPDTAGVGPLRLDLDELSPRVVTADGPSTLTLTGTLTNIGDVPVDEIGIRVQRGAALTTEGAVRDALQGTAPTDATAPVFQQQPGPLAPGEQRQVRLTVPVRGTPDAGLALSTTGVFELLVNVNGVPEAGLRARLAATRMLLPVLGLPAGDDGSRPVLADRAPRAVPFSLVYPVTDVPRRLPGVPGSPVVLTDDELADSFAPTGRLGGLVAALARSAPSGSALRAAVCPAVDPDLLQTASAMSAGYLVRAPDGSLVPGRGAEAAAQWLATFSATAAGGCVLALPVADADLVALTRGGLAGPARDAVTAGREIVAELLGTPVLPGTGWPADGVVDEAALATFGDAGVRSLLLSADGVDLPSGAGPAGVVPVAGTPSTVATVTDPLLTLAAGGDLTDAAVVAPAVTGGAADPTAARGALATQDVLGAATFRAALDTPAEGALVIAPPHRWDADGAAAVALLDGLSRLVDGGLLDPSPLDPTPTDPRPAALDYPLSAGNREVPPGVVSTVASTLDAVADLRSSAVQDDLGLSPDAVFEPLALGALSGASSAWRGSPDLAAASAAAGAAQLDQVRGTVTVLEPPGPFSLGTSDSPLLLTVANGLPVSMSVQLELASTSGLRVAPIPPVQIPPLGRRQVRVNAEVIRSGVFTVDAAVRTVDGGLLGPPSRLQVRSTAYGTITVWLTATAGVLLVVLAARRVMRRVRGETTRTAPNEREMNQPTAPVAVPGAAARTQPIPRNGASPLRRPPSAPNRPGPRSGPNPPGPSTPRPVPAAAPPGRSVAPIPVPGSDDGFPRPAPGRPGFPGHRPESP